MARYAFSPSREPRVSKFKSNTASRNLLKPEPQHVSTPVKKGRLDHLSRLKIVHSSKNNNISPSVSRKNQARFTVQPSLPLPSRRTEDSASSVRPNKFSSNLGFSGGGRKEGVLLDDGDEDEGEYDANALLGEDETAEWVEGRTLVEGVNGYQDQEDDTAIDIEEKLALVNSLQDPFGSKSNGMKKETLEVLESSLKQLDLVHSHIEDSIDRKQLNEMGIEAWDAAAEEWHSRLSEDQQDLQTAMEESLEKIKALFTSLKAEYKKRDELWTKLDAAIEDSAAEGETVFSELSVSVEKMIDMVEKKGKTLVSDRAGGVTKGGKGKLSDFDKLQAMMKNI